MVIHAPPLRVQQENRSFDAADLNRRCTHRTRFERRIDRGALVKKIGLHQFGRLSALWPSAWVREAAVLVDDQPRVKSLVCSAGVARWLDRKEGSIKSQQEKWQYSNIDGILKRLGLWVKSMRAPFEYQYRAFISYCHADTRWANWLHGRLEGFRIDGELIGRQTAMGVIPKTLRPIFRDRDDFTAGHSLSEQTLAALDASAVLILLGSPASAKSHYVNEEVRLFKLRHPDRPIIPIILDGRPGDPVAECFPPALRFEVAADGAITDRPADVIAADLQNTSDGRDLALAKVVAGMLGVPTDDVRKRQAIAQSWRLKVIAALVTVVAVLSLVAGFLVWEHNRQVAVDEVREMGRVAREVERDKQLAEMHGLVQNLLGISVAQAAPGAAKALGDAVTDAQEGAAQGDERHQKALDLLKAGKPQDAEPLFRAVAEERAARVRTDRARLERTAKPQPQPIAT